ncbi:hypothetical protein DMUE_6004, partial [Dictyocoela muelleri]
KMKIKESALTNKTRGEKLIVEKTKDCNDEILTALPTFKTMQNMISIIRNKQIPDFSPSIPDFPERLKLNCRGEIFLRYDSGVHDLHRHVIFFSEFQEKIIRKSTVWQFDGTFKSVPRNFSQLVTIYGEYMGKFYPLIYILLQTKTEDAYTSAFNKINEFICKSPEAIILDFEKSLMNGISNIFKASKLYGCNFHFGQMLWRRIQLEGLTNEYKNNENIRRILKKCFHLSIFPKNKIVEIFSKIEVEAKNNGTDKLILFLKYFKKLFIKGETTLVPSYNIEFWSCHLRILLGLPRTINVAESFHRDLNQSTMIKHPNLARFCEILCDKEEKTRIIISQVKNGSNIFIPNIDHKKEYKLKILAKNID